MKYTKVHMGSGSDIILRSPVNENAYLTIDRAEYFKYLLVTTSMHEKARMISSSPDEMPPTKVKGLPNSINPDKPPTSYRRQSLVRTVRNGQRRTTRSTWALSKECLRGG